MHKNIKGLALISAVMLMVFVSIAVLGVSVFITGWYNQIDSADRQERCIYNAASGIQYAIYQYRDNSSLTNGTFNIDADNNFTVSTVVEGGSSGDAASLVVDATGSYLGSNNRRLQGVTFWNSVFSFITIDRMIVTWNISNRTMSQIRINNSTVWSGSVSSSPADVDINNTFVFPFSSYSINRINFNNNMSSSIITLSFVMTDGSVTSPCIVWPQQSSVCTQTSHILTIKSMGKTAGSSQYRSVQATYDTTSGNISDYDEIDQTVP